MNQKVLIMFFCLSLLTIISAESDSFELDKILNKNLNEYWVKAWESYEQQDYQNAAELYEQGLIHDIENAGNIYNLACCYGLMGNADKAASFLKHAIRKGYDNYQHIVNDGDFNLVKDDEVFVSVVDSLKSSLEKKTDNGLTTSWIKSSALNPVKIKLPKNYDPKQYYPLVIGLHGYGGKADNFIRIWNLFDSHGFIFACPEASYPISMGNELGYSWFFDWDLDPEISSRMVLRTQESIENITLSLQEEYKINKVYLLGFSQGCNLTYTTGLRYPDLYDALICFGGWLNEDELPESIRNSHKNLSVFIAHGTNDRMVDPVLGEDAYKLLKSKDFSSVKFFPFIGDHYVDPDALKAAQNWLEF